MLFCLHNTYSIGIKALLVLKAVGVGWEPKEPALKEELILKKNLKENLKENLKKILKQK